LIFGESVPACGTCVLFGDFACRRPLSIIRVVKLPATHSKLRHPNCLLLMGVSIDLDGEQLLMVTEQMSGSVYDFIHKKEPPVSFKQRMKFAKGTLKAFNALCY